MPADVPEAVFATVVVIVLVLDGVIGTTGADSVLSVELLNELDVVDGPILNAVDGLVALCDGKDSTDEALQMGKAAALPFSGYPTPLKEQTASPLMDED